MSEWMIWFLIAALFIVLEISTGTLYLLMLALGFTAGGIAALLGFDVAAQMIAAAVTGAVAVLLLRSTKFGKLSRSDAQFDPNVNLDVGKRVQVDHWTIVEGAPATARVMYRGAFWNVEMAEGGQTQPGSFLILQVRGSTLIVNNGGADR